MLLKTIHFYKVLHLPHISPTKPENWQSIIIKWPTKFFLNHQHKQKKFHPLYMVQFYICFVHIDFFFFNYSLVFKFIYNFNLYKHNFCCYLNICTQKSSLKNACPLNLNVFCLKWTLLHRMVVNGSKSNIRVFKEKNNLCVVFWFQRLCLCFVLLLLLPLI